MKFVSVRGWKMKPRKDALAYKFTPSGHGAPVPEKKYRVDAKSTKLSRAFETWLGEVPEGYVHDEEYYERAEQLIGDLKPSLDEAYSLLVQHQDNPRINASGLFISAIYNRLPDGEIVFNLELANPPNYLGYMLAKGKVLINKGKTGWGFGYASRAPVINFGTAAEWLGYEAHAPVINYGNADDEMGKLSSAGVINYGTTNADMGPEASGLVINLGNCFDIGKKAAAAVINYGKFDGDGGLGESNSRIIINCGTARGRIGDYACGIVIDVNKGKRFGGVSRNALVLNSHKCAKMPKLLEYLDGVKKKFEAGRNDYRAALAAVQGLRPRLEPDIKRILRGYGYDA